MIQLTASVNATLISDLSDYVDELALTVQEVGDTVTGLIREPLMADLRQPAPPVSYPIAWQSEKQRRAYFATDGFGAGIPYKRTGQLLSAYSVTGRIEQTEYQLVVRNEAPYAKYVVGTLSPVRATAMRTQQRMHIKTGWALATDIVQPYALEARGLFTTELQRQIGSDVATLRNKQRSKTA